MRRWLALGFLAAYFAAPIWAQQTGTLTLTTEPAAEVFWQGVSIGLTDAGGQLKISGIPLGSYAILVVKDGFLARSIQIQVGSGEQDQQLPLVALASDPLPDLPTPAPPAPPATAPPAAAADPDSNPIPRDEPDADEAGSLEPVTGPGQESRIPSPLEEALAKRRETARDPGRRPGSDFERPAVIPGPLEAESDFAILVWWVIGLAAVLGSIHLYRGKKRSERAEDEKSVADFVRTLEATREERK